MNFDLQIFLKLNWKANTKIANSHVWWRKNVQWFLSIKIYFTYWSSDVIQFICFYPVKNFQTREKL